MHRLEGTPEGRMTFDEIERQAREDGNLLALAACRLELDAITEEEVEEKEKIARYEGGCDVWSDVEDTLRLCEDMLATYQEEIVEAGENRFSVERLIRDIQTHLNNPPKMES